jgi:radical SAM protein with 4Fe4S-binding SPASM domain
MTVELRPLGVRCNLQCQYCYQHPQRDAANISIPYDLEKMKRKAKREGSHFSLFGGEALLLPEEDLEDLWAWGFENFGRNGIQTNGTLINANHVRMFKQYKVHVGISIDGPGELNDIRWCGSVEATRAATAKTHAAIDWLCEEGIPPSIIVTLHRNNATSDKLPVMRDWFKHLASLGVAHARLHFLEVDHDDVGKKYALSDEENVEALFSLAKLEKELPGLQMDVFRDFRNMLLGRDNHATCIWTACDPYTTRAVHGIEGDGQSSNCGRTNKDGVDFTKASTPGFERYLALYHTPQEDGGCAGCRFFLMCKGQCPGTSIDGDWRNRSRACAVWKRVFERFEEEYLDQGVVPLSISPKRPKVERVLVDHWACGRPCGVSEALKIVENQRGSSLGGATTASRPNGIQHGDHTDDEGCRPIHSDGHTDHNDHSDVPHADHTDSTCRQLATEKVGRDRDRNCN